MTNLRTWKFVALVCCTLAAAATGCANQADSWPFVVTPVATFEEPWAMTFLPDGRLLVTEQSGQLYVVALDGDKGAPIAGMPKVDYGGQGGLGDVVLHPNFADNGWIYLSYAESGDGSIRGAAVARAKLTLDENKSGALSNLEVIWRQVAKVGGRGHYGHRIAFSPRGELFISSGERQKFDPAQDMKQNLGKIVRLRDDGSVPADNPFFDQGGVTAQIWSLGHRNPLGLAFDSEGRLWNTEMGPKHGDELNLVLPAKNYGYPIVSNGDHYNGREIPDHDTRPEFEAPKAYWVPAISPGSLMFYSGEMFTAWQGDALIGGLGSRALIRVAISGDRAKEVERFEMGARIREVEQAADGAVWLLENESNGDSGRLLRLSLKNP